MGYNKNKQRNHSRQNREKVNTTRNYKASLFSSLFSEYPEALLDFVSVKIPEGIKVEPVTLKDTLFRDQINDLALLTGNALLLFSEHMSTVSHNICTRLLLYASRTYERLIDIKALYRKKLVKLPYSIFIVLFNGVEEQPDKVTMKLSEAFENVSALLSDDLKQLVGDAVPLDLTVTQFNINKGHNEELIKNNKILAGYIEITARIRRYISEGLELPDAVTRVIRECMSEHILEEYLKKHGSEVNNMLIHEWDTNVAIEVAREEGLEEGLEKGSDIVIGLLKQGYDLDQIIKMRESGALVVAEPETKYNKKKA